MFNVRVYGILINDRRQVLVSDEYIRGSYITKFCGGGLEMGEGTIDCLKREFLEEMNLRVEIESHFYTTDFYQQSAFDPGHQIVSIYYLVKALEDIRVPLRTSAFQFDQSQLDAYEKNGETETFRFIDWEDFSADSVTLPIDKIVAGMLKYRYIHEFFTKDHVLENERARLEPLNEQHYEHLLPIARHEKLWAFTGAKVRDEADFRRYFDSALKELKSMSAYPYAVYDKLHDRYAGSTRYGNISFENKRLEIGWTWYHPELQGSGLNNAVKLLMLSYAFETLGLNRVEQKTSHLNLRSQNAMQKLGATREGTLRKHMINEDDEVRDTVYYGYIIDEWPRVKSLILSKGRF